MPPHDVSEVVPVILAGGKGRRLWPLSTEARPKPFLKMEGGKSFLQKTVERVSGLRPPLVVCNVRHRALVMEQVAADQILLEPEARNTAPAIACAAHFLAARENPLMLVMPSDHAVGELQILLDAVARGMAAAREGMLVTFGVAPRAPSSHYGYIRAGEALANGAQRVELFTEKPDTATARDYIRQGNHYWNSGIFLFTAAAFLENLLRQQPEIHESSYRAVRSAARAQNSIVLHRESFSACPALSIDYAVMENAPARAVIPVTMGWRDLGTWPSLLGWLSKQGL